MTDEDYEYVVAPLMRMRTVYARTALRRLDAAAWRLAEVAEPGDKDCIRLARHLVVTRQRVIQYASSPDATLAEIGSWRQIGISILGAALATVATLGV